MSVAAMEVDALMLLMAQILEGAPEQATAREQMQHCSAKAVEYEADGMKAHMEAAAAMAVVFGAVCMTEAIAGLAARVKVVE